MISVGPFLRLVAVNFAHEEAQWHTMYRLVRTQDDSEPSRSFFRKSVHFSAFSRPLPLTSFNPWFLYTAGASAVFSGTKDERTNSHASPGVDLVNWPEPVIINGGQSEIELTLYNGSGGYPLDLAEFSKTIQTITVTPTPLPNGSYFTPTTGTRVIACIGRSTGGANAGKLGFSSNLGPRPKTVLNGIGWVSEGPYRWSISDILNQWPVIFDDLDKYFSDGVSIVEYDEDDPEHIVTL